MSVDALPPEPSSSIIPYYSMGVRDKAVKKRAPVWKKDAVIFCKEAMNFHPHWYQEKLLRDKHHFIAACWSRQLGKSDTIAHKAIHVAFTIPDAEVIIIAPTKRQSGLLYDKILKTVSKSHLIRQAVLGRPTATKMKLTNGSMIMSVPAGDDGSGIRGFSIALLIADEAAYIPEAVFTAIIPGLASTGGKMIIISTPRGKHNEFYNIYHPEGKKPFDFYKNGHQYVGFYSCYRYDYHVGLNVFKPNGSPQISEFIIDYEKERKGGENGWKFRQEYKAEFIEDIDSYWTQELIDNMFRLEFEQLYEAENETKNYFMAIDMAKNRDKTALVVCERIDVHPITGKPLINPHIKIIFIKYWVDGGIGVQYPKILAAIKLFNPRALYFDKTTMGERPFEELQQTYQLVDIIEGFVFQSKMKISIYGTLTHLMAAPAEIEGWKSRIQCFYDEEAKKQFENLVYELPTVTTATGGLRDSSMAYIHAGQGHDDISDAIAMLSACVGPIVGHTHIATTQRDFTEEPKPSPLETSIYGAKSVDLDRSVRNKTKQRTSVFWETHF